MFKDVFNSVRSKFVLAVVIFLGIIALDVLVGRVQMARELKNRPVEVVEENKVGDIRLEVNDAVNAFELLKKNAEVEYKEYDFGVFVEGINGVKGNDEYFWSLYVNGEQSKVGATEVLLKDGDVVEWRYEKIQRQ